MGSFDFIIPSVAYFGVYALFAAIFIGFGMLCSRRVRWQFALTKVFVVIISAALSLLILHITTPLMGEAIAGFTLAFFPGEELNELFKNKLIYEIICGIIGIVLSFALFLPVFAIVKGILNLISRCIFNAVLKPKDEGSSRIEACEPILSDRCNEDDDTLCNSAIEGTETVFEYHTEESTVKKGNAAERRRKVKAVFTEKVCGLSLLLGALSGFLVYNVVISPLVMLISDIGSIAGAVFEGTDSEFISGNIESLCDNAAIDTVSFLGGRVIYSRLTSLRVCDEDVILSRELDFAVDVINAAAKLDSDKYTSGEKAEMISQAVVSFKRTTLMPIAVSNIAGEASAAWVSGNDYLGISSPISEDKSESERELILAVLHELKQGTVETAREDIVTVIEMLSEATEGGFFDIIGSGDSKAGLLEFFSDRDRIYSILCTAFKNDRVASIIPYAADVGIGAISGTLSIPSDFGVIYNRLIEELYGGYSTALNESETSSQLVCNYAKTVKTAYDNAGISLLCGEEYVISASIISEGLRGELSKDDISHIIAGRSGAFIDVSSIEGEAVFASWLEGLNFSHEEVLMIAHEFPFDKASNGLTAKDFAIQGKEDLEGKSFMVAFDKIKTNKGLPSDRDEAAEAFTEVIYRASGIIFSSGNSGSNNVSELTDSLGGILDALAECEYFKGKFMDDFVTAMLQSGTFRQAFGISAGKATDIAAKLNSSVASGGTYSQHLVAISKAINVVASEGGKPSSEDVKDMIAAVTPDTSEVLKEIVSSEVLEGNGIPKDKSESISGVMGSMIDEMAKVNASDSDPEYIEKEANAVSKVIEIATSSSDDYSEGIFSGEGTPEEKIDEYVDLVADSDIVSNSLIDVVYADGNEPKKDPLGLEKSLIGNDGTYFVSKLDEKYKQAAASGMSDSELIEYEKVIYSMAAVMNVEIAIVGGNVIQK